MFDLCENSPMPRASNRDLELKAQAERMRRLRLALGYVSQRDFAQAMGFEASRWNNFEKGFPVSAAAAQQLVARIPGLTIDWIYRGSTAGLTVDMATKLGVLPQPRTRTKRGASI